MRICIGIIVEPDYAKALIKEIVTQYRLTLITDAPPVVLLPDDDRAMIYAETDDQDVLDMLDIDEAIEVVWYDPQFHFDLEDTPISGDCETVKKLEALLEKDVDFGQA